MGWTVPYDTPHRVDLITRRIAGWTHENPEHRVEVVCIKHCYRGGVRSGSLWKVMEQRHYLKSNNGLVKTERFIALDMIRYYPEGRGMGNFGYKDLDESCGPCTISCPTSYLDMVPDPGTYATEWRKRVREAYAAKQTKRASAYTPELGEVVNLIDGISVKFPNGDKENIRQVKFVRQRPLMVTTVDGRLLRGFKKTWFVNPKESSGRTNNENHQHTVG
jgi:hypothetical protein